MNLLPCFGLIGTCAVLLNTASVSACNMKVIQGDRPAQGSNVRGGRPQQSNPQPRNLAPGEVFLNRWAGTYSFSEAAAEGQTDVPMVMQYQISVEKDGSADIVVNGQTTAIHVIANVYQTSNGIGFYFRNYAADHQFTQYRSGDFLLGFTTLRCPGVGVEFGAISSLLPQHRQGFIPADVILKKPRK